MLTIWRGLKSSPPSTPARLLDSTANAFQSIGMNKLFAEERELMLKMHENFRASVSLSGGQNPGRIH
jgi:hypothetical protein